VPADFLFYQGHTDFKFQSFQPFQFEIKMFFFRNKFPIIFFSNPNGRYLESKGGGGKCPLALPPQVKHCIWSTAKDSQVLHYALSVLSLFSLVKALYSIAVIVRSHVACDHHS